VDLLCSFADKKSKKITLKGKKHLMARCKSEIFDLLKVHKKSDRMDAEKVKREQGVKAYLQCIGSDERTVYPNYWSTPDDKELSGSIRSKLTELDAKRSIYKEVEKLITDTWEQNKVGHGQDALNLQHTKITIRKVFAVESPGVYRRYYVKKKEICLNAAVNGVKSFSGLQNERDVVTNRGMDETLP